MRPKALLPAVLIALTARVSADDRGQRDAKAAPLYRRAVSSARDRWKLLETRSARQRDIGKITTQSVSGMVEL